MQDRDLQDQNFKDRNFQDGQTGDGPNGLHVAIIGAGAAGTWVSHHLAARSIASHITLLDRDGRFGRGVAYSADADWHRLNVPAAKMGGRDDADPTGFADWLAARGHPLGPDYADAFVPRRLYGDYLCETLDAVRRQGILDARTAEAVSVERQGEHYRIGLKDGTSLLADIVILCLGNPPPALPRGLAPGARLIGDVWQPGALDAITADDEVLVIGTGATAIDAVVDLVQRDSGRLIRMVSRNGLLPRVDTPHQPCSVEIDLSAPPTIRALMRDLRERVAQAAQAGTGWQAVMDGFRAHVVPVWQRLSENERRRFMRHARSLWLIHRHRLAPDIAALLGRLGREGRLDVIAGRVMAGSPAGERYEVTIHARQGEEISLSADWVLNCTGPDENYERLDFPLVRQLFAAGMARRGPLGLGLDVDAEHRLLDKEGHVQDGLYLIGPPTRGCFWEVTAVPNIRPQAIAVADDIFTTLNQSIK